jgi:hypothetical protein
MILNKSMFSLPENILTPLLANKAWPIKKTNPLHDKKDQIDRFLEKICYGLSGCWYWRGSRSKFGYGCFGRKKAHRYSYELFNGKITNGLFVLHKCDIRNCVNPNHLFLGTQKDNVLDMVKKNRNKNKPLFGDQNPMSKLTKKDVLLMRKIYNEEIISYKNIAKKFNVSTMTAYRAITKQSWSNI